MEPATRQPPQMVERMIRRLGHVGIVVENIEESLKQYEKLFNLKPTAVVDASGGKVRVAFVPVGDGEIELLQPIDQNVPMMEYLHTHGTGIHHISLTTDDIDADVSRLREEGVVFDRDKPTIGAHGTRIIFTVPQTTDGIAIELMEQTK
jgi:methylmalonyl-CoA/ethylmalonyl-CoA epimerase